MDRMQPILEDQVALTDQLLTTLRWEYEALNAADPQAIEQAATEKQRLVLRLQSVDERMRNVLHASALEPAATGIDSYLNSAADQDRAGLQPLWERVIALAERCQVQNAINGSIIQVRRQRAQAALDLLHGKTPQSNLYDPNGRPTSSTPSRAVTKA